MKKFILLFISTLLSLSIFAQSELPILKTTTKVLSIKDGALLKSEYWTIDTELKLDVYEADKTNKSKSVIFYSDIDSISFEINPREQQDFLVIFNETDTCLTQIKSGITFVRSDDMVMKSDTIPFTLTSANNVIIETILNQSDTLNLVFHTAQNSVTLTKDAVEKIAKKDFDKSTNANTWGGASTINYSQGNTFQIKDFEWKNLTVWKGNKSGPNSDGSFGPNLFKEKVIELNFDQKIMVVHSMLPQIDSTYEKSDLVFKSHMMFLSTQYLIHENQYKSEALIHSGFGGSLLLDDEFVRKNKIGEKMETISESQLFDSHGNVLKTKKVMLPQLTVGNTYFKNVPIAFFEGAINRQKMSVIGGNILKRFNIFFDLQNAEIYLKPSLLNKEPFENS